jgi:uncharacterized membrane protein
MNPFDLPVHPAVVHFPFAMLSAAWVCLLIRHGTGVLGWAEHARRFETIGVLALPVTIVAGFVDLRGLGPLTETRWDQPLIWHVLAASAGSALFAAHALATRRAPEAGPLIAVDLGLSTAALWLLVLAGMLASEMIYAT